MKKKYIKKKYVKPQVRKTKLFIDFYSNYDNSNLDQEGLYLVHWDGSTWGT